MFLVQLQIHHFQNIENFGIRSPLSQKPENPLYPKNPKSPSIPKTPCDYPASKNSCFATRFYSLEISCFAKDPKISRMGGAVQWNETVNLLIYLVF